MLLNTVNSTDLTQSLANIFSTDEKDIIKFFKQYAMDIINEHYNEYNIGYLDLELIKKFYKCSEVRCIDEIIVNHIAPRENQELLMSEDIMTLPKTLTTNTALSRYLKEKEFEFYL